MEFCIDCEFNEYQGELISMALVPEIGEPFYQSLGCQHPLPWVKEHVMPIINIEPIPKASFHNMLESYLAQYEHVHVIADWPEDIAYFCNVLITGPGTRINTPPLSFQTLDIEAKSEIPHNALEDAKAIARLIFSE